MKKVFKSKDGGAGPFHFLRLERKMYIQTKMNSNHLKIPLFFVVCKFFIMNSYKLYFNHDKQI